MTRIYHGIINFIAHFLNYVLGVDLI